ncbi:MAG: hypothetical protein M9894_28760 [Planctomycetes bacterium]|nr:hypothetical protein [Planctomycetota bacterium]
MDARGWVVVVGLALGGALGGAGAARADTVTLVDGRTLVGRALVKPDGRVVVSGPYGESTVDRWDVVRIERGPTVEDRFQAEAARHAPGDPDGLLALAGWCHDNGLSGRARQLEAEAARIVALREAERRAAALAHRRAVAGDDADAIFEVARWAEREGYEREVVERLLREALLRDPQHAGAAAALDLRRREAAMEAARREAERQAALAAADRARAERARAEADAARRAADARLAQAAARERAAQAREREAQAREAAARQREAEAQAAAARPVEVWPVVVGRGRGAAPPARPRAAAGGSSGARGGPHPRRGPRRRRPPRASCSRRPRRAPAPSRASRSRRACGRSGRPSSTPGGGDVLRAFVLVTWRSSCARHSPSSPRC